MRRPGFVFRHLTTDVFVVFVVLAVIAVVIVVLAVHGKSGADASDGLGPIKLTKQEQRGRRLFADHCASCHELKAEGSPRGAGPRLEKLRPPAPAVVAAIRGGPGPMPGNLVTGPDAQAIAKFVEAVTAH